MNLEGLIDRLGYREGNALLKPGQPDVPPAYAQVLRRAEDSCDLRGVYTLRSSGQEKTATPLIYLCETSDDSRSSVIHRRVWNQNIAPFLVVSTPTRFCLYPGFHYQPEKDDTDRPLVEIIKDANMSLDAFSDLSAKAVANGQIWQRWGSKVTSQHRVDWTLLEELKQLGAHLRKEMGLKPHAAHSLIGRYVYLHYLHHRGILSERRLEDCGVTQYEIFGRHATLQGFKAVNRYLDDWLNGSIFPINLKKDGISQAAIRLTASVFYGDQVNGQLHLGFSRYDFAHIPVETLSVIYQQFLHAEEKGRDRGAYYTPVNLVDLILDEMHSQHPLTMGTRVLDPACGSGAFLVQSYRRLIENEYQANEAKPAQLRELLEKHIFGMDQDYDACQVAGLSLVMTMLDYIAPPDLVRYPTFRLPKLIGSNLVVGDFFDPAFPWPQTNFEWIAGNPPWYKVNANKPKTDERLTLKWMKENKEHCPVGGWQVAEAFAWKVSEHLLDDGVVGLLMPAMSLFNNQSRSFRQNFFEKIDMWCMANFSNLANILFAGRATVPAATFFYRKRNRKTENKPILTYSPFLTNQPALLTSKGAVAKEAWALTINTADLRWIEQADAISGDSLPWKLAQWGSYRDQVLLKKIEKSFPSFEEYRQTHGLNMHQGLQLRTVDSSEKVEFLPEVVGKKRINPKKLSGKGRLYSFPQDALEKLERSSAYVRKGRGETPVSVCRPPHILVGRSRQWIIFSNEFLIVPDPQVGISGSNSQEILLKALTLYLLSDFCTYHQLLMSAEFGVQKSVADKKNLEILPIPIAKFDTRKLRLWAQHHDTLVECWQKSQIDLLHDHSHKLKQLEKMTNELVFDALELTDTERWLVDDLVANRSQLVRGKTSGTVVERTPYEKLIVYGEALCLVLDSFIKDITPMQHQVTIYPGDHWGIVVIRQVTANHHGTTVESATHALNQELQDLHKQLIHEHRHWLYFERNLTIYDSNQTIMVKPMQQLHWLRSQALQDADDLIADAVSSRKKSIEPIQAH